MTNKGFVQYGIDASTSVDYRYEDYLVADRKGLEYLRLKIDEVLEGADEVMFDSNDVYVDLVGIRIADREISTHEKGESSGSLSAVGCIAVILLVLFVFVLGVWKVMELLAN